MKPNRKLIIPLLAASLSISAVCLTLAPHVQASSTEETSAASPAAQQTELSVTDASAEDLLDAIAGMPELERIVLSGKLPAEADLDAIQQEHPALKLFYHLGSKNFPLNIGTTKIDARNLKLSQRKLKKVADENPQLCLLWDLELLGSTYQTDIEELDLSGQEIPDPAPIEAALPYLYNLKKVVMCHCGPDSEAMDALNQRHEDVRFVWEVQLGQVPLRTDATVFAPVITSDWVSTKDLEDLKYCTDLTCVDLGHMWVTDISWAENMPDLTYLILADTPITDISSLANHKKLRFLELFLTNIKDLTPLVSCTSLEDLNLSYCPADPTPLYEMTWLKHLWWFSSQTLLDSDGVVYRDGLTAHLPDTDVQWWNSSSTGGEWRHLDNYFAMRDAMGMYYLFG